MVLISHRISPLVVGGLLLTTLGALLWHVVEEAAPVEIHSVAELENYLEELVATGDPPGLAVAVVKDQETVYLRAFGQADAPSRVAATPETLFNWWSITKVFTAIAILQLCEKGRLHLDDNVSHHLPFFLPTHPSNASQPVTVGHLLNHSSGIPEAGLATYTWIHLKGDSPSQRVFAEKVVPKHVRLQFEPGTKGIYTNFGYLLLGALIETVSGLDYQDYVTRHILRPLHMDGTVFRLDCNLEPRAAHGSHPILDFQTILLPALGSFPACIREFSDAQIWFRRFQFDATACGGLIGPVTDAARFMRAYLNGGELDGAQILSGKSVTFMTHGGHVPAGRSRQSRLYPGMSHGVGWFVIPSGGRLCLQHTGFGPGFASIMRLYPEANLGIVILSNGAGLNRNRTVDLLAGVFGGWL